MNEVNIHAWIFMCSRSKAFLNYLKLVVAVYQFDHLPVAQLILEITTSEFYSLYMKFKLYYQIMLSVKFDLCLVRLIRVVAVIS